MRNEATVLEMLGKDEDGPAGTAGVAFVGPEQGAQAQGEDGSHNHHRRQRHSDVHIVPVTGATAGVAIGWTRLGGGGHRLLRITEWSCS